MSLSTTAFTDRLFPPGSLEWHQQEKFRRIQRLQQQREQQRLQTLFLREIRQQVIASRSVRAMGQGINNNTQMSASGSVALTKTTSARVAATTSKVQPVQRSNSTNPASVGPLQTEVVADQTEKKKKKGKKPKKLNITRRSSSASASNSKGSTTDPKTVASTGVKSKQTLAGPSTKTKIGSTTKVNRVKGTSSRTSQGTKTAKVSFSGTKNTTVEHKSCNFYPTTSPVSILKNRKKIDDMMKSTLKPSTASREKMAMVTPTQVSALDQGEDEGVTFKPFPPPKPPVHPDLGVCKAFPGTTEWNEYWSKFAKAITQYHREMTEYEEKVAVAFKDDLARYAEKNNKLLRDKEIYKNLGAKGVELGLIPPPPINAKELSGLQLFNGYIMKSNGITGTASNIPGTATGVRFELDLRGTAPEKVMIQKDHNLLTISLDSVRFLRIGTPAGKVAGDLQVWPPLNGFIMIDAP